MCTWSVACARALLSHGHASCCSDPLVVNYFPTQDSKAFIFIVVYSSFESLDMLEIRVILMFAHGLSLEWWCEHHWVPRLGESLDHPLLIDTQAVSRILLCSCPLYLFALLKFILCLNPGTLRLLIDVRGGQSVIILHFRYSE